MPPNITIAAFVFGAVLILIALVSGGFELFGAKVSGTAGKPGRIFAGIAGLILITIGIVNPFERTASPPYSADRNSQLQEELRATLTKARKAELQALRDLNPELLYEFLEGKALDEAIQGHTFLMNNQLRVDPRVESREIKSIEVNSAGTEAQVTFVEVISAFFYSGDRCTKSSATAQTSTYFFRRTADTWKIYLEDGVGPGAGDEPC